MKPITVEWVQKAEGDFVTAERELSVGSDPNYDAVCFHSQQCVEKYLKGMLQEAEVQFEKTHDLSALLDSALVLQPAWEDLRSELNLLSSFAVDFRYPGEFAGKAEAERSIITCRKVRQLVRESLALA
jgi:HEPN domain-containing protein